MISNECEKEKRNVLQSITKYIEKTSENDYKMSINEAKQLEHAVRILLLHIDYLKENQ